MLMVESFLPPQNSTVDLLCYSLLVLPSGVRDEDVDLFGGHHPADHSSLEVALSNVLNSTLTHTHLLEGSYALSQSLVCGCTSVREAGSADVLGSDDSGLLYYRGWGRGCWKDG